MSPTQHHESSDSDTESNDSDAAPQARPATTTAPKTYWRSSRRRKHKILGLKSQVQRGNDPYDYEQKYPEDEPYKEMGPMARIWKVFLDECTKFDAEMTEDWRDALDVLLVFAGLFSAVVTTFLSQTSQNLQPDYTEYTASKISEVADLVRVAILGRPEDVEMIPRIAEVVTSFKPNRTAIWVNGLWFTSLALSLTTALLAVLTKQWIHQYMSVPSGTPRDRSRIRQFRYNSLEKWRVPMIIGLLPVLMHTALGVFFAGLVVYLRSLDTPMSAVITSIAVVGFVVYFGTNLLPLIKPDCPYKTPLTLYSQSATVFLWSVGQRLLQTLKTRPKSDPEESNAESNAEADAEADAESDSDLDSESDTEPDANDEVKTALSLREMEKEMVNRTAADIEVQCLSWLFDISSNSSVQRVVAQAFSDLPLKSVQSIREKIPGIRTFIRNVLVLPEHQTEDKHQTYERLLRALVKFAPDSHPPTITKISPTPNSLALLITRHHCQDAATFLVQQILDQTIKLDVLSWALILRNALKCNTNWLGIHCPQSPVWTALLARIVESHSCPSWTNCDRKVPTLCRVSLPLRSRTGGRFRLDILDLPGAESPYDFLSAVTKYMFPSFFELLSTLAFPRSSSFLISFPELPPDICFNLDLMRSRYIQGGFGIGEGKNGTTTTDLINMVGYHLGLQREADITLRRHPTVVQATFPVLCDVVQSDAFISTSMTFNMKRDVLHALFRSLLENHTLVPAFFEWLTPSIVIRIRQIAFDSGQHFPSPLLTEIIGYECGVGSSRGTFIATAYAYLTRRGWLQEIKDRLSGPPKGGPRVLHSYVHSYPFLAAEYVNGLATLQSADALIYEETINYLQEPCNTIVLAKLLLMADIDRRRSLLKLVALVGHARWTPCCVELRSFLRAKEGSQLYGHHAGRLRGQHPFRGGIVISHGSYADLDLLLSESMRFDSVQPLTQRYDNGLTTVPRVLRFLANWRVRTRDQVDNDESGSKV